MSKKYEVSIVQHAVISLLSTTSIADEQPGLPDADLTNLTPSENTEEDLASWTTAEIPLFIKSEAKLWSPGHRSHRSHSSHRSHYSSRGGTRPSQPKPPVFTPPKIPTVAPQPLGGEKSLSAAQIIKETCQPFFDLLEESKVLNKISSKSAKYSILVPQDPEHILKIKKLPLTDRMLTVKHHIVKGDITYLDVAMTTEAKQEVRLRKGIWTIYANGTELSVSKSVECDNATVYFVDKAIEPTKETIKGTIESHEQLTLFKQLLDRSPKFNEHLKVGTRGGITVFAIADKGLQALAKYDLNSIPENRIDRLLFSLTSPQRLNATSTNEQGSETRKILMYDATYREFLRTNDEHELFFLDGMPIKHLNISCRDGVIHILSDVNPKLIDKILLGD